jgi:hypothetical protein
MIEKEKGIFVTKLRCKESHKIVEISVKLKASHLEWQDKKLWYSFPKAYYNYITESYDPFLAALLPLALKTKSTLVLDGVVSERLVINCQQIMKIYSRWFDNMNPIDIQAKELVSYSANSKSVGSFFTGGVDSFYTVLKNLDTYQNESRITHLLYVHGFDIDVDNQDLFETVKKEIKLAVNGLELEHLFIKTNLRQITDQYVRWGEEQHGAALASAGLCLSPFLKTVYIPSSVSYSELYKWASHPNVDPLWSNEQLQFIHDGNEANRSQKILWQLSNSKVALKHLRVCWKNPNNKYNCGECGKCIRTKINLEVAGVLNQCDTLDNNIDGEIYKKILLNDFVERRNLSENLELIGENNQIFKERLHTIQDSVYKKRSSFSYNFKKVLRKARSLSNHF